MRCFTGNAWKDWYVANKKMQTWKSKSHIYPNIINFGNIYINTNYFDLMPKLKGNMKGF